MNKHFGILLLGFIILLMIVTPSVVSHTAYGSKKNSDKNSGGGSSDGKGSSGSGSGDSGNSNDNPPADSNQQSNNNQPTDQQVQQQEQQNQQQPCPDGSQPDDKGKCPTSESLTRKSQKENCDNGIDDNGDRLVDKQDPQCAKAGTTDNTGNTQTSDTSQPTTSFYDNKQLESMPQQPPPCPDNQSRDASGNCPQPASANQPIPCSDPDKPARDANGNCVPCGVFTGRVCPFPKLDPQQLTQPSTTGTGPTTEGPTTTFGLPQPAQPLASCPDNKPRDASGNCPPPQSSLTGQLSSDPDLCLKVFGQQQVKAGIPTPPQCKSPPQNNGPPSTDPQNLQQQKLSQPSGTGTEPATNTNKPLTTLGLPQPLGAATGATGGSNTEPSSTSTTEQPSTSTDKQPATSVDKKTQQVVGGGDKVQKRGDLETVIEAVLGGDIQLDPTPTKAGPKSETKPDGTVITTYPDGRKSTRNTDGTIIIENPPGSGIRKIVLIPETPGKLGSYTRIETVSSGSTFTTKPDGTETYISAIDGYTSTTQPDGKVINTDPITGNTRTIDMGKSQEITRDRKGGLISTYDIGTRITTMADGTKIKIIDTPDAMSDGRITEKPDGTITTDNPDGTWNITFPKKADGSQKMYFSDGRNAIKNPDGTITFLK